MSELETIVAAINGLGEGAMSAFIVWICITAGAKVLTSMLVSSVFITLFVMTARTIKWCVTKFWENVTS